MFNSTVLDLATGLIFCFLTVSLATGTIVEAIASLVALRARTLRRGVGQLVNDTGYSMLAKEIYAHAAVNPRGDGTDDSISAWNRKNPAYIDRQLFGQAMLDILQISSAVANAANDPNAPLGKPTVADLKTAVSGVLAAHPDAQLQKFLHGIIERSLGDPDKIKAELVAWFDNAMDRVSGWYKRKTQVISILVGFVLAAGLNIDAIEVAKALWTQPKLAEELKPPTALPAGGAAAPSPAGATAPATSPPGGGASALPAESKATASGASHDKNDQTAANLLHQLNTKLPVGYPLKSDEEFGIAFLGWLITAFSTLFGAPFWFDLLQTVIRLKGTGPSPVEKVDGKGAAA